MVIDVWGLPNPNIKPDTTKHGSSNAAIKSTRKQLSVCLSDSELNNEDLIHWIIVIGNEMISVLLLSVGCDRWICLDI